jgi:hypothetical protein
LRRYNPAGELREEHFFLQRYDRVAVHRGRIWLSGNGGWVSEYILIPQWQ